jgi:hypothetical protein
MATKQSGGPVAGLRIAIAPRGTATATAIAACVRLWFSSHLLCFRTFSFLARSRGNHLVNTGD